MSGKAGSGTSYYIGAGYLNQKGIVYGSDFEKLNATLKVESKLSNKLKIGASILPSLSGSNYDNEIYTAMRGYPFFNVYNPDGSLAISEQINGNTAQDGALDENAIARTDLIKRYRTDFRAIANTFLTYQILPGLQWRSTLGGDLYNELDDYYDPSIVGAYRTPAPKNATASEAHTNYYNLITEHTLNFDRQWAAHQFSAMAGYSFQRENGYYSKITGSALPDDNLENIAGASSYSVSTSRLPRNTISTTATIRSTIPVDSCRSLPPTFLKTGCKRAGVEPGLFTMPTTCVSETSSWATISALVSIKKIQLPQPGCMSLQTTFSPSQNFEA